LRTELERIAGRLENFEAGGDRLSALAALKRLCCAVQCGNLRRGLVLTDSGVVPACVANKFRGVRACVGGGVMDIDEAVRELGINVLVIEYPNRTFHEMRQMVKRLVTGDGHPTASVGQAITTAETSNCGCALAQSWDR
jgi:ribose 5-phosphate isomerase RpiB